MFASDNGILMTCGDGTLGCLGKEHSINGVYTRLGKTGSLGPCDYKLVQKAKTVGLELMNAPLKEGSNFDKLETSKIWIL